MILVLVCTQLGSSYTGRTLDRALRSSLLVRLCRISILPNIQRRFLAEVRVFEIRSAVERMNGSKHFVADVNHSWMPILDNSLLILPFRRESADRNAIV